MSDLQIKGMNAIKACPETWNAFVAEIERGLEKEDREQSPVQD